MHSPKVLIGALAAAGLALAMASPAAAQNIANPVGTPFNGTNVNTWVFSIGTQLQVRCTTVALDGTPLPASVGVRPNTLGGPSTRMAEYLPTFGGCSMALGGALTPAQVTAQCDWAHAVDAFNGLNGQSRLRMAIGVGPCESAVALTLTNGACTITVPTQVLVHNNGTISLVGQNTPAPPAIPTGMLKIMNVNQAIARTVSAGCAPVGNPLPLASMAGTFTFNAPGVWAGP